MKKMHKVGIVLMTIGFSIWLSETIIFLIIQGWHYKATNDVEMALDLLAQVVMRIGFFCWVMSAAWIVNLIYKEDMA